MTSKLLRPAGTVLAGTLVVGLAGVALSTSASAIGARYSGTPIGTLALSPTTGDNLTVISYTASAPCPGGTAFTASVYGFGFPDSGQGVTSPVTTSVTTTAPSGQFQQTMQTYADQNATTLQGDYDVVVSCVNRTGTNFGDFRSTLTFPTPTTYTTRVGGPAPSATPTATMSPTPTPTATMSPSPSASPSVTPTTAAPTATASPTPTASTSPTTSPTAANPCTTPARVTLTRSTIIATGEAPLTVTAPASSTVELYAYSRPSTTYRLVRTGVTSATGTVGFAVKPPTNTRLYAIVRGCTPDTVRDSVVLNVRTAFSLFATRTGLRTYRFSGDSLPARSRGLIVSLYRVTASGSQVLTSQTRADGVDGTWEIDRTFTGSGRFGFVVRTGQDLQNAPGSSNVRPTLIF